MTVNLRNRTKIMLAILLSGLLVSTVLYKLLQPITLTIAVDTNNNTRYQMITAIAQQIEQNRGLVRLQVTPTDNMTQSAKRIDNGEADFAVVDGMQMPIEGQTVAVLQHNAVFFIANSTSDMSEVTDFKRQRIGITDDNEVTQTLLKMILNSANLTLADVKLVVVPADKIADAFAHNQIDAMMISMPLQGDSLANTLQAVTKATHHTPTVFGVTNAEALVQRYPMLESYEVKAGVFTMQPSQPEEDGVTLAHSDRLIARSDLRKNFVNYVTSQLFDNKPQLLKQFPQANDLEMLDTETGANLNLHAGAKAWYNGEQQSFMERYGDVIYIGISLITGLISLIGGLMGYLRKKQENTSDSYIAQAERLLPQIRQALDLQTLQQILQHSDSLLHDVITNFNAENINPAQFSAYKVMNQHINMAIQQRILELK